MPNTFSYDSHIQKSRSAVSVPHGLTDAQKLLSAFKSETGTFTLGTYATNGFSPNPAKFGMSSVSGVTFRSAKGYVFDYDPTTDKIKVYTAPNTEVANATDLSGLGNVYFEAKGQ